MKSYQKIFTLLNLGLSLTYIVLYIDDIRRYGEQNNDIYLSIVGGILILFLIFTLYGIWNPEKYRSYLKFVTLLLIFLGVVIFGESLIEFMYCFYNICEGYPPRAISGYLASFFICVIPIINLGYFMKKE